MQEASALTVNQFQLVLNTLNLTVAVFGGFALLFALAGSTVAPAYRLGVAVMTAVFAVAGYHYLRIYGNWQSAFAFEGGAYLPSSLPVNHVLRYADWIGTVPLILAATVLVLDLGRDKTLSLVGRLAAAAVLMIGLGYVGELERGVGLDARQRLDGLGLVHQRDDLGEATEGDGHRDQHGHQADVLFDFLVCVVAHGGVLRRGPAAAPARRPACGRR